MTKNIDRKGWWQLVGFVCLIAAISAGVIVGGLIWLL